MVNLICLTTMYCSEGSMDSVTSSETRRQYIHVGSGTASMLCTVSELVPESISIALDKYASCFILRLETYKACSTHPFFPLHFFQTMLGFLTVRDKHGQFVVDEPVFVPVTANR